jgi:hypothetical protein
MANPEGLILYQYSAIVSIRLRATPETA